MGFDIGNKVAKNISLEQLTKGLDPTKDKKKIDRITQIFNKYNTNTEGSSAQKLDIDEQVSIMSAYHKSDKNNDNHITRNSLRKAGFSGEYKAYRDFMEAYQKATAETSNTFELKFKDDIQDDKTTTSIKATQNTEIEGKTSSIEHDYVVSENQNKKIKTTLTSENGQISYTPKGQIIRQKVGDTTLRYNYDNEAKHAKPNIIKLQTPESYDTVKLQDDGTYLDDSNNKHYRLNNKKLLDEFTVDDKGRVTKEIYKDKEFSYKYNEDSTQPASINVTQDNKETTYTKEKDVYSVTTENKKDYYKFDSQNREFIPTEAPKPDKQNRPQAKHLIRMTQGWKNQRINKDNSLTEQLNTMSTADEVLTALVEKNEQFKETKLNKDALLSDLIKNNPSMFNAHGEIYSDAVWEKLDFPSNLSKYVTQ